MCAAVTKAWGGAARRRGHRREAKGRKRWPVVCSGGGVRLGLALCCGHRWWGRRLALALLPAAPLGVAPARGAPWPPAVGRTVGGGGNLVVAVVVPPGSRGPWRGRMAPRGARACGTMVAWNCWVYPRVGGAAVCRPRRRWHRSDGASVLVGVARRVHCSVADRDACWGGEAASAVWSSMRVVPCLVALVWLGEWKNGGHIGPPPVVVEVGEGVVWVGRSFGGVVSHMVDVVDALWVSEHGDVYGPLVRWSV